MSSLKRRKFPQLIVEEGDKETKLKNLKRQLRGVKNRNRQYKSILESIPKAPKTIEPPKIPTITEIESSWMNGYMNFDVDILNRNDPQLQLSNTKPLISNFLLD